MSTAASPDPKKHQSTPPTRMMNVWWMFLVLLLLWNFAGFLFRPDILPVVTLPYSMFIEQVKHDSVSVVDMIGNDTDSIVNHPMRWTPKLHPAATSTTGKSLTAPKGASLPQKIEHPAPVAAVKAPLRKPPAGWLFDTTAHLKPTDYDAFLTTLPDSIVDAQLVPLLESHCVQIKTDQSHKSWLLIAIKNVLPFALLLGYFWWTNRCAMKQQTSNIGIPDPDKQHLL